MANIHQRNERVKEIDREWLSMFYERTTNQFTLARESLHNTHQWAITLTFGIITAVFTLSNNMGYPNEYGLIVLLLTFPLMIRFFFRSCLEYSIQRKWQEIRNCLDKYYLEKTTKQEKELIDCIETYYFLWKSPIMISKIICDNLKLAYFWPFLLYFGLIGWGYYSLLITKSITNLIIIISILVLGMLVYEIVSFVNYRGFKQ
ncbi:MAG: hypothetical protein HPY72_08025 [Anaerolineae bacterium]|nr:hypothetical protein [Anaerolineae bacterium]